MDRHDAFIIGSLASSLIACMAGTIAGFGLVFGASNAWMAAGCFGFVAMIAFPAGFILAFSLMSSPHRCRWLFCRCLMLGIVAAVISRMLALGIGSV